MHPFSSPLRFGLLLLLLLAARPAWAQPAAPLDPTGTALLELGKTHERARRYEEALRTYEAALAHFESTGAEAGVAQASYDMGLLHWHVGRFDEAVGRYEAAMSIWERLGDRLRVARCLNNIGVIYYHWGGYRQALSYYTRSLALRRETGDARGAALVLNNIGKTYEDGGQLDRALEVYAEAYTYARDLADDHALGYTFYNLAGAHAALGARDSALAYYDRAEAVYRRADYLGGILETLIGKGVLYREAGDASAARATFEGALAQARADSLVLIEATALHELGRMEAGRGDHPAALARFHASLATSQRLGKRDLVRDNYRQLSSSHEALGHFDEALRFYERYAAEEDSIFGERSERLMAEVEARYEAEREAKENVLLRRAQDRHRLVLAGISLTLGLLVLAAFWLYRANRQKREANRRLVAANRALEQERDEHKALLQILCHDLANPLASVRGCLQVMLEDPEALDEFGAMALKVTQQGMDTIDLVREMQVLDRDRIRLEPVGLLGAVEDAALPLRSRLDAKALTLDVHVDPSLAVWAEHRSLPNSVVANLLTNAIKFSPPGATIDVRAAADGDEVWLAVRDHGIGIPAPLRDRLFDLQGGTHRPGTQGETGSGFGMRLVHKFMGIYGGRTEVTSRERREDAAGGTEVRLIFRAAPAAIPASRPGVNAEGRRLEAEARTGLA